MRDNNNAAAPARPANAVNENSQQEGATPNFTSEPGQKQAAHRDGITALRALCAYVFSHTTSRVDVELGARLFRHLVQLPQAYFQARRVGDSVARVWELENRCCQAGWGQSRS